MLVDAQSDLADQFQAMTHSAQLSGGTLQMQSDANQAIVQVRLQLPLQPTAFAPARPSPLSEREREVIQLLVAGHRDRDIAKQLYISDRTVKFHVKNVLTKLQVKTRIQAVYAVAQAGWLDGPAARDSG